MSDLLALMLLLYLIGGLLWFTGAFITWWVDRGFRSLYSDEEIALKAHRVLQTPIWPLVLLGMAGRVIGELQKDVMR